MRHLNFQARKAFYFCLVLLCFFSTLAFAQFRVLCELSEALESAQQPLSSHASAVTHIHSHEHAATTHAHHPPDGLAARSHTTHHAVADKRSSSNQQDEPCCKGSAAVDFAKSSFSPKLSFPQVQSGLYFAVVDTIEPTVFLSTSNHIAQLAAPPPLSLSHIPTTVLRI